MNIRAEEERHISGDPWFSGSCTRWQEVGGGEFDFEYDSFEGSFKLPRGKSLNSVGWMYRFKAWKRGKS